MAYYNLFVKGLCMNSQVCSKVKFTTSICGNMPTLELYCGGDLSIVAARHSSLAVYSC